MFFNVLNPFILAIKASMLDTLSCAQAMAGPDTNGYCMAMKLEVVMLQSMGAWDIADFKPGCGSCCQNGLCAASATRTVKSAN